ncbi:MAG TPA: AraC family transcriptional regulator [Puia sp.]|nr:AraC family transcriptional regulator [Puia sp.]
MNNFYKYLPTSEADEKWGICVLNAGCNSISKHSTYPAPDHPDHHNFNWQTGRVLDEYQLIYIPSGTGKFESANCGQLDIKEGSIFILFPNEWHRFKPDEQMGWDEFWVGFKGKVIEDLVVNDFLSPKNPVLSIGFDDTVIQLLSEIVDRTRDEKTGYQQLVSGMVFHLLGKVLSLVKERSFEPEDPTECIINKARIIFRTNIDHDIVIEKVAEELNISYAWFRRAFKKYTGIAPNQYIIQLKIEKAKALLTDHSKSVKAIAFSMNFESAFYFSKLFKEKTGSSPEEYRKKLLDQHPQKKD